MRGRPQRASLLSASARCRTTRSRRGSSVSDSRPAAESIRWAQVETGFYVGSRGGEFLGYIDRSEIGRYTVCDLHSRPVADFGTLDDAMEALSAMPSEIARPIAPVPTEEADR